MSTKEDSSESKIKISDKDDVFVIHDDGDEDVPGDFFDDFLKEDFMAGLDIVDDDQWENNGEVNKKGKSDLKQEKEGKSVKKTNEKDKGSRSKQNTQSSKLSDGKERPRGINADEFDIRRDPNKTRRDIQRDKVKCEKDKEKKLISEKLKLVETGLVPPGMEMEVDIAQIDKDGDAKDTLTSRKENTNKKVSQTKSVSPKRRQGSPKRRSRNRVVSPIKNRFSPRKYSLRRSPIRRKSRERRSRERNSRERRSRERISRERRSRERISIEHRSREHISRDGRSRGRSMERPPRAIRRSRSASLHRDRRPRYSPDYPKRRRRSRSRSRDRQRDNKNHEAHQAKKSFLQEIAEKLRGSKPSGGMMPHNQYMQPGPLYMHPGHPHMQSVPPHMQPSPVMTPVHGMQPIVPEMQTIVPIHSGPVQPVPVPAPSFPVGNNQQIQTIGHQNQYDPYDQSYFIGTPVQLPGIHNLESTTNVENGGKANPEHVSDSQQVDIPQLEIGKLFHDKKITLSEFLAISAKPEVYSASPGQLKDKIKVLSRCHDAIKILEAEEKKFQGPFQLRRTVKPQLTEPKYKSPLVRLTEAKIAFTEIPTKENNKSTFNKQLNNLLQGIGLLNETVEVEDDTEPMNSNVTVTASPPPPPHISRLRKSRIDVSVTRVHTENRLAKMVQTEPMPKCADCEKRRKVVNKTSGCQTGELMTYSVSTQVTEDDFFTKIPKNQSLASLTPAQLLAQNAVSSSSSKRYAEDDFDIYPAKSSYGRGGFDYPRASDNYSNSGNLNPRYLSDRDRDESLNNSMYPGARGRGANNFDIGPRYSYY